MDMSQHEDLARLRAIAEEGRNAPLLGGGHLILWGGAIATALIVNWLVDLRILPWPGWSLAISWFGIVFAAWIGSALIGRREAGKPGAFTIGNKVERAVWITVGGFLMTLAVALFVRGLVSGDPRSWELFAIMSPVTLGAYAVALSAAASATNAGADWAGVVLSLGFAAATAFLIGDPAQYPVAAAGVALVTIPAGLRHVRAERRAD
jgi:hypothetical protein